jgi:hypothetical protein
MAAHTTEKCRLVTRSDLDGLVRVALLAELVERVNADG